MKSPTCDRQNSNNLPADDDVMELAAEIIQLYAAARGISFDEAVIRFLHYIIIN